jgi:hypothetical protein
MIDFGKHADYGMFKALKRAFVIEVRMYIAVFMERVVGAKISVPAEAGDIAFRAGPLGRQPQKRVCGTCNAHSEPCLFLDESLCKTNKYRV